MKKNLIAITLVSASLLVGCATNQAADPMTLKDAYKNDFLIGVAINQAQFTDHGSHLVVDGGDELVGAVKSASLLAHVVGAERVHLMGPNGRIRLHQAARP